MNSMSLILGPFLLTFLVAATSIVGCGLPLSLPFLIATPPPSQQKQKEVTTGQLVTLDGYDASTGIVVRWITLWKERNNRAAGVSATANHGEGVKFIQLEDDSVLVETREGKRGWVTSYFIKEFK